MTSSDMTANLAEARESENFNRAWFYLDNIKETNPQYEQVASQRDALQQQTELFETKNITQAQELASAGRWREAFETLKNAQTKWRKGEQLSDAEKTLRQREALLFDRLRTDLLVDEARWLATEKNTLIEISTLEREDALLIASKMDERKAILVSTLNELGESFAAREDWRRTRDLLNASRTLSGNADIPSSLATAQRHLANRKSRNKRVQEQKNQNKALALLDNYDASHSLTDLLSARDYISENNRSGQLDQYAARLEAICQQRFSQGINNGDALYAQGKYEEAQQAWQSIRDIYPGNVELDKKLERASRVINNLKALSN